MKFDAERGADTINLQVTQEQAKMILAAIRYMEAAKWNLYIDEESEILSSHYKRQNDELEALRIELAGQIMDDIPF